MMPPNDSLNPFCTIVYGNFHLSLTVGKLFEREEFAETSAFEPENGMFSGILDL
jgi:hypothetical protein